MPQSWEELAADKRARLAKTIPDEWKVQTLPAEDSVIDFPKKSGILSEAELKITEASAADLVSKLAAGELTSVEVTLAFCKRAAIAQQLVGSPLPLREM
jgi:amidase